jgi:leader peptidase (prepilin peptidase)/N-methyltransferase
MAIDGSVAWIVVATAALAGLLIGSFLNVVTYRVPAGMSLSTPPSACPNCHTPIKPYDNIPVVSWLVLRARCRGCGTRISARYPLVEAGTAVFFGGVAFVSIQNSSQLTATRDAIGGALVLVALLYLAAVTVSLGLIDLDTHTLPNRIVLPAYLVSLVLFASSAILTGQSGNLLRAVLGMAILWAAYAVMAFAYPGGMGFGDVKLAGLIGIYLGWVGWGALAVGALAAFVLGGLYSVVLIASRRANRKSGIPFGPWMLAGAWVGVGVGNVLAPAYLSIFGLSAA